MGRKGNLVKPNRREPHTNKNNNFLEILLRLLDLSEV
jgi:hypothetical protein